MAPELLVLALIVQQIPVPGSVPKSTAASVFATAAPSVVVVEALDASGGRVALGSGVVVANHEVVTNCHVIKAGISLRVHQRKSRSVATLLSADQDHDLCTLKVPELSAPPARIRGNEPLQVGENVYALGAPQGLELTISEGLVSSLREHEGAFLIQTSAAISPGSSGGGLFDQAGKLVGITTFSVTGGQNLNFALPVAWFFRDAAAASADLQRKPTPKIGTSSAANTAQPGADVVSDEKPNRTKRASWSSSGWLTFRWGMGVGDVNDQLADRSSKGAVKATGQLRCDAITGSGRDQMCSLAADYHQLSLSGASPDLTFVFAKGRLWIVYVAFEKSSDVESVKKLFKALSLSLKHKYGPPEDVSDADDRVPTVRMASESWYQERLGIELSLTEIIKNNEEDGANVDLRYSDPLANKKLTKESRDKEAENL
jgi:hypothetical protein